MELINPTPLPGIAFRQFDQNGELDCVVALRGTFEHVQNGAAHWRDRQMPLQWQDAYEGDPQTTPLLHQGDLVPEKPGTDITFLGSSHAPDGPKPDWTCGMEIGPVRKTLHVSGQRDWRAVAKSARWPLRRDEEITDWDLTEASPVATVPIDWRLAAGGSDAFIHSDPDPDNRIGCGRVGLRERWQNQQVSAPQVSATAAMLPSDAPAGLAPIPPFWRQRYRHAGTYDEAWEATRHPLLPEDFDPRFWQCAPEDQIARPFLQGDEDYRLINLHPEHPFAIGQLPKVGFAVRKDDGNWLSLNLDGVQFDWRQDSLLLLTWRARFPLPEAQGVKLRLAWHWLIDAEDVA